MFSMESLPPVESSLLFYYSSAVSHRLGFDQGTRVLIDCFECAGVLAVLRSSAVAGKNKCGRRRIDRLGLTPRGRCIQFTVARKLQDYGA